MGIGIEELRKCGTALPIDYAGRLNWLFMRRVGTFIDAGCHQPFTESVSICLPLHKVPDKYLA